jgi:hypothetical protein
MTQREQGMCGHWTAARDSAHCWWGWQGAGAPLRGRRGAEVQKSGDGEGDMAP